jgi:hypothetical protein
MYNGRKEIEADAGRCNREIDQDIGLAPFENIA